RSGCDPAQSKTDAGTPAGSECWFSGGGPFRKIFDCYGIRSPVQGESRRLFITSRLEPSGDVLSRMGPQETGPVCGSRYRCDPNLPYAYFHTGNFSAVRSQSAGKYRLRCAGCKGGGMV